MAYIIEDIFSPVSGPRNKLFVAGDNASRRIVLQREGTPELHLSPAQAHELLSALHSYAAIYGYPYDDRERIRKGFSDPPDPRAAEIEASKGLAGAGGTAPDLEYIPRRQSETQ